MNILIKPLSVNNCWQGKRFKTPEYKAYEHELLLKLPKTINLPDGSIRLDIQFGVSNMQSDVDNPVKPFLDILQKKYKFNDSRVTKMSLEKIKVKKGFEFIQFEIKEA